MKPLLTVAAPKPEEVRPFDHDSGKKSTIRCFEATRTTGTRGPGRHQLSLRALSGTWRSSPQLRTSALGATT
jgi:hypothetical protein